MFSRLKSLPLTIVLTILIWMYAEAQFTSTRDNVRLSVKLVAPTPDLSVRVLDAQGAPRSLATIIVTLQGPKNRIDTIYQQSQEAAPDDDFNSLTYSVPRRLLNGSDADKTMDTASLLNSLPYFRQRSVTITAAVPPRIKIETDTMEHVTRTVEFRPAVAVSHFTLNPDEVTVNVPSRTLAEIGGPEQITVLAVPQRDLAALPPDTDQMVPVRFTLEYPGPRDERVTVGQGGTVSLHLPRRQGIQQVVPDVPVWVAGPPATMARYDVELRTNFVRVTVAGSAGSIAELRRRMAGVGAGPDAGAPAGPGIHAYLDITPEDRPAETYSTRRLRYVLPEGLTLQDSPPDVEFRLVEHTPATTQAAAHK